MNSSSSQLSAVSVKIENLSKKFNGQPVLHDINLDIQAGETFVIMGPSGSGKSVLLKHIIGLLNPDSGKIYIQDQDSTDVKIHRKFRTAIVFQAGALFNSMTVFENLAFYPKEHRLYSKPELQTRVEELLSSLSLEGTALKYPSELSGGMKKRVAIARALMMEPQLLLYDEPTSELDPIMAATISEIIGTLKQKFQVTSIVVSHDRDLAFNIADRVAILQNGKVKIVTDPKKLRTVQDPDIQEFLNPTIDVTNPRFRYINTHKS